jgi:hypothetical protein
MKPQLLKVRSGQVFVFGSLFISTVQRHGMNSLETYLSRFSVKILKNDYSTIFITVNMINLNIPKHNGVDFSISYLCGKVAALPQPLATFKMLVPFRHC